MIWNVKELGVFIMKTATAPHQTLRLEKWPNAKLINHQNFIKQKKKKKTKSNKSQHAKTLMLPAMPVAFLMKIVAAKQMVFLWWQTIKSLNVALLCQNNLTFHLQSWSQNRANYQSKINIKKITKTGDFLLCIWLVFCFFRRFRCLFYFIFLAHWNKFQINLFRLIFFTNS